MECICETCGRKDCPKRTKQGDLTICILCNDYTVQGYKMTNADRIRVMRDRELADFLSGKFSEVCCSEHSLSVIQLEALKHNLFCIFMKWLKQPAE